MQVLTSEGAAAQEHSFKVFEVPEWRARFYRFLSVKVWGNLPSNLQRTISSTYSSLYDKPFSKKIIRPYIKLNYGSLDYLKRFKPPFGKKEYESFQDFFIREFSERPNNTDPWVWPCEGLLCENEEVGKISVSNIKADRRELAVIFGVSKTTIPSKYSYTNVFLHNKNYHRIHAPITGTISRIQHIPGDLVVLRPWIYKQNPSLPAFRNERYNIDITDENGRVWYLSIVGGPAVGTIELPEYVSVGSPIAKLQQIALFYLGSTCCMAAPRAPRYHRENTFVAVGDSY